MKTLITASIDIETVEMLKNVHNKSALINGLLKEYFARTLTLKRDIQSIQKDKIDLLAEQQRIAHKIAEVEEIESQALLEQSLLKDAFKAIPGAILEDFKRFPGMTPEILRSRYSNIYLRQYKINWSDLENAYNTYFKKGADEEATTEKTE